MVGIVLIMPDVFWPVFKTHRHLQHDLPALGAAVLQQWAWNQYRVEEAMIPRLSNRGIRELSGNQRSRLRQSLLNLLLRFAIQHTS